MSQKNTDGYILLSCLLIIACLSLINSALLEQSHWQQRLLSMFLHDHQATLHITNALEKFIHTHSFAHDTCTLEWQNADQRSTLLYENKNCCLYTEQAIEIRYLLINNLQQQPESIAFLVRSNKDGHWAAHEWHNHTPQDNPLMSPMLIVNKNIQKTPVIPRF